MTESNSVAADPEPQKAEHWTKRQQAERQELMQMVQRSLSIQAEHASEILTLKRKVDTLEERVSIAAGQYRQTIYAGH